MAKHPDPAELEANARKLASCPLPHRFQRLYAADGAEVGRPRQLCLRCGGTVRVGAAFWYRAAVAHAGGGPAPRSDPAHASSLTAAGRANLAKLLACEAPHDFQRVRDKNHEGGSAARNALWQCSKCGAFLNGRSAIHYINGLENAKRAGRTR